MSKWLYFHASAIDSNSVTSHDSGTNIDFGAFPAESITSIMAEEDQIYLYFKNATRFEPVLDNYAALEGTFETMEQVYVRLTTPEDTTSTGSKYGGTDAVPVNIEEKVILRLLNLITRGQTTVIKFDAVNSNFAIPGVTAVQIRRHLTTHTIGSG